MTFIRLLIVLFVVTLSSAADTSSCRSWKPGVTICDPYTNNFLRVSNLEKGIETLRHKPITKREAAVVDKIRIKNGLSLHSLINKYIKREERLYYKAEIKRLKQTPIEIIIDRDKQVSGSEQRNKKILVENRPTIKQTILDKTKSSKAPAVIVLTSEKEKFTPKVDKNISRGLAVYVVKKGDSITSISRRFGLSINSLLRINNLKKRQSLKAGKKLRIPISQERLDTVDVAFYIVKKGDTLSSVARNFNVKLSDLKKYNTIRKKSIIHVGQGLVLPLPHKLVELKRIEEKKKKAELRKKRERERLARIELKKAEKAKFLRISKKLKRKLSVTATAYTSHRSQTDSTPFLAAWNNRLRPGMKIIAVSRDLIYKYGITNGSKVRISGLPGIYTVRDKMNKRWRRRIDIYMGMNRWRALRWGRKKVTLYY